LLCAVVDKLVRMLLYNQQVGFKHIRKNSLIMLQKDLIGAAYKQTKMRRHSSLITGAVSIFLLCLFLALIGYFLHHASPLNPITEAQAGVLDLSGVKLNKEGLVSLDGEWEFYWLELPEAEEIMAGIYISSTAASKNRLAVKSC
jgi:hypothetical protein